MSPSRRLALAFALLFALSQALLWWAYYAHGAKPLIGDEAGYQQTALAILAGGAWMPGTIWPPLQPLILAAVYAVAGVHVLAAQLLQTVLFIGCAILLRDLWRRLGGRVRAANAAAALFLLNPATAAYAQWLWPEIPHLFLLLAVLCLLARSASARRGFAAGVCIGLALLAKSLLSAFWPLFLLAYVRRVRPWFAWRPALALVFGAAIVTAPALWHGWRTYGTPMIADSSVYNLWVGLGDRWRSDYVLDRGGATLPEFLASAPTPQQRNAIYLDKVRRLVAERGVADIAAAQLGRQYFRLLSAKTPLVSQLPGPACAGHLSIYTTSPWLTQTLTRANDVFHAFTLAAAAFGIALWRWRRTSSAAVPPRDAQAQRVLAILVLFVAYQLTLFALVHVKARFFLPLTPIACGFAGSFLADLRDRQIGAATALAWTPLRIAIAALLALLLLVLAFAGPALDGLCAA